jgi:hypothetical protein
VAEVPGCARGGGHTLCPQASGGAPSGALRSRTHQRVVSLFQKLKSDYLVVIFVNLQVKGERYKGKMQGVTLTVTLAQVSSVLHFVRLYLLLVCSS